MKRKKQQRERAGDCMSTNSKKEIKQQMKLGTDAFLFETVEGDDVLTFVPCW